MLKDKKNLKIFPKHTNKTKTHGHEWQRKTKELLYTENKKGKTTKRNL